MTIGIICSSGKDRSRRGSRESFSLSEGSRGVDALPLIPAVHPHRSPGMGMPASMSARVQAFIAAAKRDPSDDKTET